MRRLGPLVLVVLAACGYGLAGTHNVPETAHSVRVEPFHNHTHEVGLEVRLHRALEDEFRRHGRLRVIGTGEGEADLVLSGNIRRFTSLPVAFSSTDEAVQYQSIIQVGMRLVERESGRVLHETRLLQETQDFGAVGGVVVATSPHFQRGTMDARDLASLGNVQIGEARRHDALRDLMDALARDIYLQTMEGF